jgi:hypothetical protein
LKEKKYNYTIKKINEKEEQKKVLNKDIKELQEKFRKLKNEIVVDINTENKKDIQVIKSKDFDTSLNNELLINEEIQLNEKYKLNKELNNLVSLRYDQVINSLNKLCTKQSISYMKEVSQNASKLNNKSDINNKSEININNKSDINNVIDNDKNNNKEISNENIQNSQESSQLLMLREKMKYTDEEENKVEGNDKDNNSNNNITNKDNTKINENNTNDNNNDLNNDNNNNNENNNNNDNNENIDNNININDNNIENRNMIDKDLDEEKRLINSYKEYLSQAEKTIDTLFLIKTKKDFLQMVRDKATEYEEANKTMRIIKRFQGKNRQSKINSINY